MKEKLMLQEYRHIIWDWNGTLIDDAWVCVEIINEMLQDRGRRPITHKQYEQELTFPVKDFYEKLGFDFSVETFEALADEYIGKYDKRCFECRLHEHAIDVLHNCLDRGLRHSILSAYHQVRLEEMLDHFDLRPLFTHVMGLDDHHARGKTQQGIRLARELDQDADQAVMIGDTVHDYDVARAIGADCILFVGGHNCAERLRSCGVPVVTSLAELLE
jgi:phosphoglycolate phosphatase